ncbi:glycoside hydrolase family 28 protein [Dactylonectria macrodidyma]|uniref:endo-polygalacturonase n=1 Tax=Dactylonectria macrodidyma TaxID=307937 RepID=A0A9P9DVH9_9HYPO|nr:glycoside hydrolase family 28 protein [Dactylonectria macrodidyma]
MTKLVSLLLAALAGSVVASPAAPPTVTQAPELNKRADLEQRAVTSTCTFSGANGAASASASKTLCATIVLSDVAVPSGVTLDLGGLNAKTHVIFKGTTTWGYKEWDGPLLRIGGTSVTVDGASATLNPDGKRWWDNLGADPKGKVKPKFFYAHDLTTSTINDLHILNTPLMAVSIVDTNGLNINNMIIDNSAGDSAGGHNTDGFDIGDSTSVTITNAKVYNQDDCVAVNSGSDITFTGGLCSGGHGLSIGSVGGRDNNKVSNVKFLSSTVTKSVQAIRIKTVEGATGSVSGVTYSDITMSSISNYGIIIEQNYNGGDLKGTPSSGVPITGLTISNIIGTGSVASSGYNIVIACGTTGCSNWTWSKVAVTGGKTYGNCSGIPSGASC